MKVFSDGFGEKPRREEGRVLKRPPFSQDQHAKPGWVYLFALPDEWQAPLYKIGLSTNPIRRASQIKGRFFGDTVMIAACFKTDNMSRDELDLMEAFAEFQTNDYEYFTLGEDELCNFILMARELAMCANNRVRKVKR